MTFFRSYAGVAVVPTTILAEVGYMIEAKLKGGAVIAERLFADTIATTDLRHFSAIRPLHAERFTLVP